MAIENKGDAGIAGPRQGETEAREVLDLPQAEPATGAQSNEDLPAEGSGQPLPVEEQVANANAHYGSQVEPETFDARQPQDEPSRPADAADDIVIEETIGGESIQAPQGGAPDASGGGILDTVRSLVRGVFASGSPGPRGAVENSPPAEPAESAPTIPHPALPGHPLRALVRAASETAAASDGEPTAGTENAAPVASDVSYSGPAEDGSVQTFAYAATDADTSDTLTYSIVTQPSEGAVADNGDGTFGFDPGADFQDLGQGETRQVSFTYRVDDGNGGTDTAIATLTVAGTNDAPVASDVSYSGPAEDGAVQSFAYAATDADASDTLTYSIVTQPAEGAVADNGDGTFGFDPGADFQDLGVGETRQVSFTYRVDDGNGGTDTATATITVAGTNDAPVAADVSYAGPAEDGAVQSFAYAATDADTSDTLTYSILTQPSEGSVADNGDGTFGFDPGADFQDLSQGETRQVSFTYRVDDGQGGTDTAIATITVAGTNDAPVAQDDSFSGAEDTPLVGNVLADNGNGADSDIDGDSLTVTTTGSIATAAGGTVTMNADGSFTYTPASGFAGTDSFAYTISDGNGGTAGAIATIQVAAANSAPTDITLSDSTVAEYSPAGVVVGTLSASDPDAGDTFTYAVTGGASDKFEIDGNRILVKDGANLDFETAASHQIDVEVTDS
ncbi:MAG TPA: Ig-like domain-containing protein, partial [Kiloniellales bacterium]